MNTNINNSSIEIDEWLSKNALYNCLPLNAKITHKTCIANKNKYKRDLKDECIPKDYIEQVEYCVFKCDGLTKTN